MLGDMAVVEGSFRNVKENGKIVGFAIDCRVPFYRSVPFSCVTDIKISIDGKEIPTDEMIIKKGDKDFKFEEFENLLFEWWNMMEPITIFVEKDGGLAFGNHDVDLFTRIRVPYLMTNVEDAIARDSAYEHSHWVKSMEIA